MSDTVESGKENAETDQAGADQRAVQIDQLDDLSQRLLGRRQPQQERLESDERGQRQCWPISGRLSDTRHGCPRANLLVSIPQSCQTAETRPARR